jgi:hypothetical protein
MAVALRHLAKVGAASLLLRAVAPSHLLKVETAGRRTRAVTRLGPLKLPPRMGTQEGLPRVETTRAQL